MSELFITEYLPPSRSRTYKELLNGNPQTVMIENKYLMSYLPYHSGIYALIKNDDVIYVGQSRNIAYRLINHLKTKDFDSFYACKCSDPNEMNRVEAFCIVVLNPKLNVILPNNDLFLTLKQITQKFNTNFDDVKRLVSRHNIKSIWKDYYFWGDFENLPPLPEFSKEASYE